MICRQTTKPLKVMFAVLLCLCGPLAWAQTDETTIPQDMGDMSMDGMTMDDMGNSAMDQEKMDHETMGHGTVDHGTVDHGAMDHGNMQHGSMEQKNMDHGAMDHGTMDHGSMSQDTLPEAGGMAGMTHGSMQGGSAPADARDPHAYSGGYSLTSGPYLLSGSHLHHTGNKNFVSIMVDRFESVRGWDDTDTSAAYELQAAYGRDFDKAVLKAEGHIDDSGLEEAGTELLWSHAVAAYWNTQLGLRYDSVEGVDRYWLAGGIQGLAPYWFEVDLTAYVGEEGRGALRLESEYELLLTQKLILQPRLEATMFSKSDPERGLGSGLAELTGGIRLRYEFVREFGPYLGIERSGAFGSTSDYLKDDGKEAYETRLVAGVRFWF